MTGLGDVNLDGVSDLASVTVTCLTFNCSETEEYLWILSGQNGSALHRAELPTKKLNAGWSRALANVGDVDGDGTDDLVLGVYGRQGYDDASGRAFVVSGADGALLFDLKAPSEASFFFGYSVSGAGDVNGDGLSDIAVGDNAASTETVLAGRVYLFSGANGALLRVLEAADASVNARFGVAVAPLGDVDRDGVADLAVGAHTQDLSDELTRAGQVYVFSGATGRQLYSARSPYPQQFGLFGQLITPLGDIDLDGRGDFAVQAWQESAADSMRRGRVYVFSGANGSLLHEVAPPEAYNEERLFGYDTASAGDFDGDRVGDLAVVERRLGGADDETFVHVYSGVDGRLLATVRRPGATQNFAWAVRPAGDVNGDNRGDLAVVSSEAIYVFGGAQGVADEQATTPAEFALGMPFPNPLEGHARLVFTLANAGDVRLSVFDMLGREVEVLTQGRRAAGVHTVSIDAENWAVGAYIVRLVQGAHVATRRLVLAW